MTTFNSGLIIEPEKTGKKLLYFLKTGDFKRVVLVSWHGLGDQIMLASPFKKLRALFPDIKIDIAVCRGLDQTCVFPDAIEVDGNWRETLPLEYDLVVQINAPIEKMEDLTKTKAEVCCVEELGIEPTAGHEPILAKKLVGVSFQCTSVPWVANTDEAVAEKIWEEIKRAGFVPFECSMKHPFFNPENKLYPFVDKHMRDWPATVETLAAFIGSCHAYITAVSGNFHLALSVLGRDRVMLLEKDLKRELFTKEVIATADVKEYKDGSIKKFLENLA